MTASAASDEILKTDLTRYEIGPFDVRLPGPMGLTLDLDGEVIVSTRIETGFLHRGLEKTMERLSWNATIAYADRLDSEAAVFNELALCLAVEEIADLSVPPRAMDIRLILCELNRIAAHLGYIVRFARAVSSETMMHYVLRDREKILDLFELITGARFTHNFIRFGGVRADVTEGFIERVFEVCELLKIRIKEYNDLFTFNYAFIQRSRGVGWLTEDRARAAGITGPNARASGLMMDVRKEHPILRYSSLDFKVPGGRHEVREQSGGDCNDRFVVRLREISESIEILKQVAESISSGEFRSRKTEEAFIAPLGEAWCRVESPRGLLGCHVVSDGSPLPGRIQYRVPSQATLQILPDLLIGSRMEDLPVILASVDLGIAEVDR